MFVFLSFTQSIYSMSVGGERAIKRTGEGRVCVAAWQHSHVHKETIWKLIKIILGDICTVLEEIIKIY